MTTLITTAVRLQNIWSQVWFSRELQECMNIFVISFANE